MRGCTNPASNTPVMPAVPPLQPHAPHPPKLPLSVLRRARLHAELAGLDAAQAARAVARSQQRCSADGDPTAAFWHALYIELAPLEGVLAHADPSARALSRLSMESRTALLLRLGENLSPAAIAAVLDEPVSRTRAHLALAMSALREQLGADQADAVWLGALGQWLHRHETETLVASPMRVPAEVAAAADRPLPLPGFAAPARPAWHRKRWTLLVVAALLALIGVARMLADDWLGDRPSVSAAPPAVDPTLALLALPAAEFELLGTRTELPAVARLDFFLWWQPESRTPAPAGTAAPTPAIAAAAQRGRSRADDNRALWERLSKVEQGRRLQRMRQWLELPLAQRAALHLNLPYWRMLDAAQQREVGQRVQAFAALPAEQQQRLEAEFDALPPAARRALLPTAGSSGEVALARELFAFLPLEQRDATLAMLADLDRTARDDLRALCRRMPPWQREAVRLELLQQPPAERPAWLRQRLARR